MLAKIPLKLLIGCDGTMTRLSRLFQRWSSTCSVVDSRWTTVVGLEVHAQLASRRKLFSPALVDDEALPNTMVAPFDRAIPGSLPILNWQCVELAVRAALALDCTINHESYFDRKHYNYPDLPAGYQITQQRRPLAVNGTLSTGGKRLLIRQIHLEQDTARTYYNTSNGELEMIDLNRCGVGLVEIVTGPDIRSSQDAVALAKELRQILVDIGTCNGVMARGHLRFDVNVSVTGPAAPPDAPPLGERVEIKNINTFKGLEKAIQAEAQRQISILEAGARVERATRSWDERQQVTRPSREKESTIDYRFLPEFDLSPLLLDEEFIERIRAQLPPSRDERMKSLLERGISTKTANVLINHPSLLQTLMAARQSPVVADFLANQYLGFVERYGRELNSSDLELVLAGLQKGAISRNTKRLTIFLTIIFCRFLLQRSHQDNLYY